MSGFGPSPVYPGAMALDPTKHVNYVEGMVLGSADLRQEFTYHAQRDQWLARDLVGYGTVWGLQVSQRIGTRGPEIVVASGVALSPRGQLIRVAPAQCAPLNDWLAGRTTDVNTRKQGAAPVFSLPLYVVLGYRSCDSDPVPIAGEPCRTEQDSVAPSRTGDDFQLELTFDPPPQIEEDALREFFAWLSPHITVTGGGTASLTIPQFLEAIRAAAKAGAAAMPPPPATGPRLVDAVPAMHLSVPAAAFPDYLRATLRLWVTELRPQWRPSWLGDKHGWAGDEPLALPDEGNRVVLAKLTVLIVPPALNNPGWTVAPAAAVAPNLPISIIEDKRPFLVPLRFLQEWLLAQSGGGGGGSAPAGPQIVAAGVVVIPSPPAPPPVGPPPSVVNGLKIAAVNKLATAHQIQLSFGGYTPPNPSGGPQYLVKALSWPGAAIKNLTLSFGDYQATGFSLLVSADGQPLADADLFKLKLIVEVSQYS